MPPESELRGLRVCLLAGTLAKGGAEQQLFYQASALQAGGADVIVLSLTRGEFLEPRLIDRGVQVRWVGQEETRVRRLRRIMKEVRSISPDILQSTHFYTNLYAAVSGRFSRIREIGALRNDVVSEVRSHNAILGRLSLQMPRVLVANSNAAIRTAMEYGIPSSRLNLLLNVVDTGTFKPLKRRRNGRVRLLSIGRLVPEKNFPLLLAAVKRLKESSAVDFEVSVVGSGPLRDGLLNRSAELGLEGVVQFHPATERILDFYHGADLLVSSSDHEGTPNVILEGMACGLPVVATRAGGVGDIVRSGETGYLVDRGDIEGLVFYLDKLLRDQSLRGEMADRARVYALANHSIDELPKALSRLYNRVLS